MMRKPIFTAIATILALALTAGLAFGAGRLVSTRNAHVASHQGSRVVAVQLPFQGPSGAAFRHQMHDWMRGQFASLRGQMDVARNHHPGWRGNDGRSGRTNQGTGYAGGYQDRTGHHASFDYSGGGYQHQSGYRQGDHWGSSSWGGRGHEGCCGW